MKNQELYIKFLKWVLSYPKENTYPLKDNYIVRKTFYLKGQKFSPGTIISCYKKNNILFHDHFTTSTKGVEIFYHSQVNLNFVDYVPDGYKAEQAQAVKDYIDHSYKMDLPKLTLCKDSFRVDIIKKW
jgi:hypothetical protein